MRARAAVPIASPCSRACRHSAWAWVTRVAGSVAARCRSEVRYMSMASAVLAGSVLMGDLTSRGGVAGGPDRRFAGVRGACPRVVSPGVVRPKRSFDLEFDRIRPYRHSLETTRG